MLTIDEAGRLHRPQARASWQYSEVSISLIGGITKQTGLYIQKTDWWLPEGGIGGGWNGWSGPKCMNLQSYWLPVNTPWDVIYSTATIANKTINLKVAMVVDLKSSHQKKQFYSYVWWWVFTRLLVVIDSQYIYNTYWIIGLYSWS